MGSFEESRWHGYSAADFAADMAEAEAEYEKRCADFGCHECEIEEINPYSRSCEARRDTDWKQCPYFIRRTQI